MARLRDIRKCTAYSFVSLSTGDTAKVHFSPSGGEWKMRGRGREGQGEKGRACEGEVERDVVGRQFRERDKKHPRYNFAGRQERINETRPNDWLPPCERQGKRREGRGKERKKKKRENWIARMQKFSSSCSSASLRRSEVTRIAARGGGVSSFLSRAAERLLPLCRPAS